jgi:hypothetical protein
MRGPRFSASAHAADARSDIAVPSMGESMTEGTIAVVLKKPGALACREACAPHALTQARPPGDAVAVDEVIAQIETDKVTMDVRAPAAGVIDSIQARCAALSQASPKHPEPPRAADAACAPRASRLRRATTSRWGSWWPRSRRARPAQLRPRRRRLRRRRPRRRRAEHPRASTCRPWVRALARAHSVARSC